MAGTSSSDKRSFWKMAISEHLASGLSVREFCKAEGLSEPSFYHWRRELGLKSSTHEEASSSESGFKELHLAKSLSASALHLSVQVAGLQIQMPLDASPNQLDNVFSSLAGIA